MLWRLTLWGLLANWLSHWLIFDGITLINMFLYGMAVVGFLLAYFIATEPEEILSLTKKGLLYRHRYGSCMIPWSNVQRIDIPKLNLGLEQVELDYIGIKVKDSLALYESIPLRLASRLMVEQRPLWLSVAKDACQSGRCVPDDFVDAVEFKASTGQIYTGLIAMFMYRYQRMTTELGFHFYIPLSGIDMEVERLLGLLREAKSTAEVIELSSLP